MMVPHDEAESGCVKTAPDHRLRAIYLHRRAQKAEAAAARASHEAKFWLAAWKRARASRNTAKRKLNRTRALLRAARWTDPTTRIIELGRLFP